jgi:hypothetical protein
VTKKALVFALLFWVAPSAALAQAQPRVFIGGGLTFPMGEISDTHGRGYNVGTQFSWPLSSSFALLGAVEYRDVRRDDEATVRRLEQESDTPWTGFNEFRWGGGFLDGGNRSSLSGLVHGQLLLRPGAGRVTYYLLAGGGLSRTTLADLHVYFLGESDDFRGRSEVAVALDIGAGVNVQLGEKVGAFAQASRLTLLTEGASTNMLPIQLGLSFIMTDRFVR